MKPGWRVRASTSRRTLSWLREVMIRPWWKAREQKLHAPKQPRLWACLLYTSWPAVPAGPAPHRREGAGRKPLRTGHSRNEGGALSLRHSAPPEMPSGGLHLHLPKGLDSGKRFPGSGWDWPASATDKSSPPWGAVPVSYTHLEGLPAGCAAPVGGHTPVIHQRRVLRAAQGGERLSERLQAPPGHRL